MRSLSFLSRPLGTPLGVAVVLHPQLKICLVKKRSAVASRRCESRTGARLPLGLRRPTARIGRVIKRHFFVGAPIGNGQTTENIVRPRPVVGAFGRPLRAPIAVGQQPVVKTVEVVDPILINRVQVMKDLDVLRKFVNFQQLKGVRRVESCAVVPKLEIGLTRLASVALSKPVDIIQRRSFGVYSSCLRWVEITICHVALRVDVRHRKCRREQQRGGDNG